MSYLMSKPCLLAGGVLLMSALDVVAPELVTALDPMPPSRTSDGIVGRWGPGPTVAARLDAAGVTAQCARAELAAALGLVAAAHSGLPERTRRRLGWPPEADWQTPDRWLVAYAKEPAGWLLDLAGGLMPESLLRCCLLARPQVLVELWLDSGRYGPPRIGVAVPQPAPVSAGTASALLRRPDGQVVDPRGRTRPASGC